MEAQHLQLATSGDRWICMSNALTRAGHGLTLAEKRLVMAAVSKLDSRRKPIASDILKTKITAAEYAELAGCGMSTAYEALYCASKNLFDRKIIIFEPAHKRNGKPLKPLFTDMRWVGRCHYHAKEGWVELAWWPELLPHLFGFKRQFTKYQLKQASALRSTYSWRLLELLMRFESTGQAEYTIEDFAAAMDATEKQQANFACIRRKIIEPAVKELQDKDGWLIEWHQIKAGRKVKAVHFQFKRDPQGRLFGPDDEPDSIPTPKQMELFDLM